MKPVYLIVRLKNNITSLNAGIEWLSCAFTTLKDAKTYLVCFGVDYTLLKMDGVDLEYVAGKKPVYYNCDD